MCVQQKLPNFHVTKHDETDERTTRYDSKRERKIASFNFQWFCTEFLYQNQSNRKFDAYLTEAIVKSVAHCQKFDLQNTIRCLVLRVELCASVFE